MSMTVTCVIEDSHGLIGIAANERAAKQMLIDTDWVNEHSQLWIQEEDEWCSLLEMYGENWLEEFLNFTKDQLEDMDYFLETWEVCE